MFNHGTQSCHALTRRAAPPAGLGPRSHATPRKWTRRARRGNGLPASPRIPPRSRVAWPTGCSACGTRRGAVRSRRPRTLGRCPRRGEAHKHATSFSRGPALLATPAAGCVPRVSRAQLGPRPGRACVQCGEAAGARRGRAAAQGPRDGRLLTRWLRLFAVNLAFSRVSDFIILRLLAHNRTPKMQNITLKLYNGAACNPNLNNSQQRHRGHTLRTRPRGNLPTGADGFATDRSLVDSAITLARELVGNSSAWA